MMVKDIGEITPQESPKKKCHRTACNNILDSVYWRLFNEPSIENGYNDYCPRCGRKIIQYNQEMFKAGEIREPMKYFIMRPTKVDNA